MAVEDKSLDDRGARVIPADAAVFHIARIDNPGRAPALGAVAVASLVGVAALWGLLGSSRTETAIHSDALITPTPAPTAAPAAPGQYPSGPPGSQDPDRAWALTIHTRAWGRYVYVHGDVFTLHAEVVAVTLWSGADEVLGLETVSIPAGQSPSGPGAGGRFLIRFDVGELAGRSVAVVQATAYNDFGIQIGSTRQELSQSVVPGWWRRATGRLLG